MSHHACGEDRFSRSHPMCILPQAEKSRHSGMNPRRHVGPESNP